ncbi:MAG: hypothetical protein ICV54_02245 [Nostoc sp. C3-bin3]|nr:hypothetical protein [Nostoc sp. C3-bin3]
MANVLLTTHWSTGEVYPFIRIGRELKARGHDVSVITNCYFKDAVQKAGLNFLALDTPEEFEQLMTDGYLFNTPQGFLKIYQKYVLPKVVSEYELIAKVYRPKETVLVARDTPGIAARIAAQKLEMPLVAVMSSPSHLSTRSLVAEMIGSILGDEINQIRKEISLSAVENWSAWLRETPSKTIGLWADWFADATPEESSEVLQPGFIWDKEPLASAIPIEVQEFLQQEPSPILITGGTTSLAGEKFFAVSAAACKLLGRPGLLVTRHEKLVPSNLPDGVKWVKYLPSLASCMPYTSAIIHHGGLVTSGQALAAGIPQLVLGGGADQLYTGSCLNRLGVGESLSLPQWQPEIVAQSLHRLTNLDSVRDRCRILTGKFIGAHPVATICDVIEALISLPTVSFNKTIAPKINTNPVVADTKNQKTQRSQLLALAEKLSPEKLALLELKLMNKDRKIPKAQTIQPLLRQPKLNYFPLSFAQQRLWFLDQLEPENPAYNISGAVQLTGLLNIAALKQSFDALVQRHEVIRTTFAIVQEQAMQVIAPNLEFKIPIVDLQDLPENQQQQQIQTLITEEQAHPFNLAQGPLLRVTLLRLNPKDHVMLFSMHHIISDGWSMGILIQEIAKLYEAFSTGKTPVLPELPIHYADFAVWQRQWLQTQALETQLAYWKSQLAGKLPVLNLASVNPRPQVSSYRGASYSFNISANLSQELQELSHQAGVTLFMTLLAAFQILLYRYTKQEDIIVGSPIASRNYSELEGLIGFFINILVLRTNLSDNPTFKKLLQRVRKTALGAYAHQDLPFEKLVAELQPERNLNHSPLFQVLFVLQNAPKSHLELKGLNMSILESESSPVRHDLKLQLTETPEGLQGFFEYKNDLFHATAIARMAVILETILTTVVEQPEIPLDQLVELLHETEKQQQILENQELQKSRIQKLGKIGRKAISGKLES